VWSAEVHQGADALDRLAGAWRQLHAECADANPFQSWEWQRTWYSHFGGATLLVITAHIGSELVAIFPMIRNSGMWSVLRPTGIGPSDYLQPLVRKELADKAGLILRRTVMEQNADLVDLQQLREGEQFTLRMGNVPDAIELAQATCLVLDLPDSYDAYLKSLSQSLRYDMRRLDTLLSGGTARIEMHAADTLDSGLDILFALHSARWRRRGLPGALFGRRAAFHRNWARLAAQRGWLWLTTLWLDGEPAGALYVMRTGDTAYYYQSGLAVRNGGPSPGTLLLAHTIRRAIDAGVKHLDFLRGDEPYKRRFKPQHELKNLRLLIPGSGPQAQAALAWNAWGHGLEQRIRGRLEGAHRG
jgi:CelD/BcsL family acetyltransferase involved in cellulose biosynthesis